MDTPETAPMPDLTDLIARVEGAGGADRELDREIMLAVGYRYEERDIGCRYEDGSVALDWVYVDPITAKWRSTHPLSFSASLDAAMTLVPEGWNFEVDRIGGRGGAVVNKSVLSRDAFITQAATPALALCAAALKARNHLKGKS